jgi:hypothetical protein
MLVSPRSAHVHDTPWTNAVCAMNGGTLLDFGAGADADGPFFGVEDAGAELDAGLDKDALGVVGYRVFIEHRDGDVASVCKQQGDVGLDGGFVMAE